MSSPALSPHIFSSPLEEDTNSVIWQCLNLLLTGMYIWEMLLTMPFDLSFLTGKRQLRWALAPYFVCRYSQLGSLISFQIMTLNKSPINCQALAIMLILQGNLAIGCVSLCLAIRTIAIWMQKKVILAILGLAGLVQWALIFRDIAIRRAHWDDQTRACVIGSEFPTDLLLIYFPSMAFDLLVLVLSTIGLFGEGSIRSQLQKMLFRQGLLYFLAAFTSNLIPVIFVFLGMAFFGLVFTGVALFVSVVAACRVVRELILYSERMGKRRELENRTTTPANVSTQPDQFWDKPATDGVLLSTVVLPSTATEPEIASPSTTRSMRAQDNRDDIEMQASPDTT
ncbi:hypothetical protein DFH11DRAFT_1562450 [Phellopilus nigrolimitatus]|nr:hypothetical protein DFH11DRAFT_1562450 [Phellopilus nigrolimitatus]